MRSKEEIRAKFLEIQKSYDELGYDNHHDWVYYQLQGLYEDWDDIDSNEELHKEVNKLVDQLEAHIKHIINEPEIDWIYG